MSRLEPHPAIAPSASASTLAAAVELTKPGITRLVAITVGVGFVLGASEAGPLASSSGWGALCVTAMLAIVGAALAASGASALNEWLERDRDAAMSRTSDRPVPAGRLSPAGAFWIGLALSSAGIGLLLAAVNWASAAVALATIVLYLALYTPLKPLTPFSTLVGAVPGALPPLVGWTAAFSGPLHGLDLPGGWSLFFLMFVWQIPHVLAIAWRHREDYERGGHRVLPVVDRSGARTGSVALVWAAALVPVSLAPVIAMGSTLGWLSAASALAIGGWHLLAAKRFAATPGERSARSLFLASIIYLPSVLAAMVADASVHALL